MFKPRGGANLFPRHKLWDLNLDASGSHTFHYVKIVMWENEESRSKWWWNGPSSLRAHGDWFPEARRYHCPASAWSSWSWISVPMTRTLTDTLPNSCATQDLARPPHFKGSALKMDLCNHLPLSISHFSQESEPVPKVLTRLCPSHPTHSPWVTLFTSMAQPQQPWYLKLSNP